MNLLEPRLTNILTRAAGPSAIRLILVMFTWLFVQIILIPRTQGQAINLGTLHLVGETRTHAIFKGLDEDGKFSFQLGDKVASYESSELVAWSSKSPEHAVARQIVVLTDSSIIAGTILAIKDGRLFINNQIFGLAELPVEAIAAIIWDTAKIAPRQYVSAWKMDLSQAEDSIYLKSGDVLLGVWENINSIGETIGNSTPTIALINHSGETTKLNLSQIAAVRFSPILKEIRSPNVLVRMRLSDGSELALQSGSRTDMGETQIELASKIVFSLTKEQSVGLNSRARLIANVPSDASESTWKLLGPNDLADYRIMKPWTFQPAIDFNYQGDQTDMLIDRTTTNSIMLVPTPSRSIWTLSKPWTKAVATVRLVPYANEQSVSGVNGMQTLNENGLATEDFGASLKFFGIAAGKLVPIYSAPVLDKSTPSTSFSIPISGYEKLVLLVEGLNGFSTAPSVQFEYFRLAK